MLTLACLLRRLSLEQWLQQKGRLAAAEPEPPGFVICLICAEGAVQQAPVHLLALGGVGVLFSYLLYLFA
jgi:hypothetical protein